MIYINCGMLGYIFILGFNLDQSTSNAFICKIHNYLLSFPQTMSGTILILASIDRLLISSQNVDTRLYSSRRLAYFSISISTVFWMIYFLHVIIRFDIQYIGRFIPVCLYTMMDFYEDFLVYSTLVINIVTFLAMIFLSILSFKNVRRIRSIPRRQRQIGRTMHKKDFQLLRCLFVKDILYIISNVYLCVYILYRLYPKSQTQTESQRALDILMFSLGCFIQYIPSCTNVFVFMIVSRTFRQNCKCQMWKICCKDFNAIREEELNELKIQQTNNQLIVVSTIAT